MAITKVERARRARIKAGKALTSDIHTSKWWSKRYREAKKRAKKLGISSPWKSRKEYIASYVNFSKPQPVPQEGGPTVTIRRSSQFFDIQYKRMQDYARQRGLTFPYKNKSEFISNYMNYAEANIKRPLDRMRYFLRHKTAYNVALNEYKKIKEAKEDWERRKEEHEAKVEEYLSNKKYHEDIRERMDSGEIIDPDELEAIGEPMKDPGKFEEEEPEDYSFRELQDMTVQEFAEENKDLLSRAYHERRAEGKNSYEAKDWVSAEWFGS